MTGHADTIREYIRRAADWGDAGVGHGDEMAADLAEGLAALDALLAELQKCKEANDRLGIAYERINNERQQAQEELAQALEEAAAWHAHSVELAAELKQAIDALREVDTYIKDLAFPGPEAQFVASLVGSALENLGEKP